MADTTQESGIGADLALLNSVDDAPEKLESDNEPILAPVGDEEEIEVPEVEEPEVEEEQPEEVKDLLPHERPTLAQLNTAYPDILKKFPALKDIYYRERQYSEVFATPNEAKEALGEAEAFQTIREEVLTGSAEKFFSAVREADPDAIEKLAGNLLPALYKISPDIHYKAALPLMENLIKSVYQEGLRYGDSDIGKNLQNSALHIAQFLFGENSADIATGKRSLIQQTPKIGADPEKDELKRRLNEADARTTSEFISGTRSEMISGLKNIILERGQHNKLKLDPEGNLSEFIKNSIVEKTMEEVGKVLEADKAHMSYMNSLWAKARKAGYVGDWKSRIQTAYLERVKSLVPAIRNRLVAEALGVSPSVNDKRIEQIKKGTARREPGQNGRDSRNGPQVHNPRDIDYRKTSDLDILNGTVTLRKK